MSKAQNFERSRKLRALQVATREDRTTLTHPARYVIYVGHTLPHLTKHVNLFYQD